MRTLATKKGMTIALGIQGIKDFLFGIDEHFDRNLDKAIQEERQKLELMQRDIREAEIRLDSLAQEAAQAKTAG
jgi:hypothetical protein